MLGFARYWPSCQRLHLLLRFARTTLFMQLVAFLWVALCCSFPPCPPYVHVRPSTLCLFPQSTHYRRSLAARWPSSWRQRCCAVPGKWTSEASPGRPPPPARVLWPALHARESGAPRPSARCPTVRVPPPVPRRLLFSCLLVSFPLSHSTRRQISPLPPVAAPHVLLFLACPAQTWFTQSWQLPPRCVPGTRSSLRTHCLSLCHPHASPPSHPNCHPPWGPTWPCATPFPGTPAATHRCCTACTQPTQHIAHSITPLTLCHPDTPAPRHSISPCPACPHQSLVLPFCTPPGSPAGTPCTPSTYTHTTRLLAPPSRTVS